MTNRHAAPFFPLSNLKDRKLTVPSVHCYFSRIFAIIARKNLLKRRGKRKILWQEVL
ncbi:hypothetical protein HMPREF6123_0804 [Oribacterium sinus F0268]|uniref:Uncharacterized protein n=1 Tax=Oribacterium sinus F0268 TaxID=585501 RepID=C2KWD5_9FIRM|nr:hypothetical protein HMPREF6123_0804 [Oribacterium sinus F0268]